MGNGRSLTHTPDRSPEFRRRRDGLESHTPEHQMLRIRARLACDQPLYSNGDRVAHRTDNSVAALLELSPKTGHGQGFNPAPSRPRTIRAGSGQSPRVDIPISTRTGTPPRKSTSPQVDAGHEPSTRFAPGTGITERSYRRPGRTRLITRVLKTHYEPLT